MLDLMRVRTDTFLENVRARNTSQQLLQDGKDNLGFLEFRGHRMSLFAQRKVIDLELIQESQAREINSLCARRPLVLVRVTHIHGNKPQILTLEIIFFSNPLKRYPETTAINFNEEKVLNELNKHYKSTNDDQCLQKFHEECHFSINGEPYFLIHTAGVSADTEEMETFSLHSNVFTLSVKTSSKRDQKFLEAYRLQTRGNFSSNGFILVQGALKFTLQSANPISKELVKTYQNNAHSYLNIYKIHLYLEYKRMLTRAQRFGARQVKKIEHTPAGYKFYFSIPKETLTEDDSLCLYIQKEEEEPDIEPLKRLNLEDRDAVLDFVKRKPKEKEIILEIIKIEDEWVEVETQRDLKNKELWVWLNYYGEKTHLERKQKALEMALNGSSANPNLFLILDIKDENEEDEDREKLLGVLQSVGSHKMRALTPKTTRKVFKSKPPTPNQKEAIKIALNTPDIAIIQGPPGTGKTTLINAICERLYEEYDPECMKSVLVCAHGHDATINVCNRLEVGGLPTPKFGNKKGEDSTPIEKEFLEWSQTLAKESKKEILNFSQKEKILEIENALERYRRSPIDPLSLLDFIEGRIWHLDKSLHSQLEILKEKLTPKPADLDQRSSIYALRTTPKSFEDDGMARNQDLLYSAYKDALSESQKELLQEREPNLQEIKALQEHLLACFTPAPHFSKAKRNQDLEDFVEQVLDSLKSRTTLDRTSRILIEYVQRLENNPDMNFFKDYSFVSASTTGQSDKVIEFKKTSCFDTVIIDEAAKISPLDLLIVMVLAKKRIILVGDHRQLPHEKDEEITQEILRNEDVSVRGRIEEMISESMFSLLKKRAIFLEKIDEKKRQITLSNQYRTHPILGKFVSDVFYEQHGEGFQSPLDATHFAHHLDFLENKPCAWIDIKITEGIEKRSKTSLYREAEVDCIMKLLSQCKEENPNLSFGVITFYRAQKDRLEQRLQTLLPQDQMPRIGTVDSFQGMEFDIVFLSAVRTSAGRSFGFLKCVNRLCVSMSRQKKALIVVGELDFYKSPKAQEEVPGLYNFIQLCEKEGKIFGNFEPRKD
ncbi:DEAD/DEAH box helicase [Helicobacter felis]|uniref:DEAD/DEAH box helicase n=1 Tax=Helicobacter felis TaxID=214 RepID=UPI001F466F6A|nr:AAA domain-containing protein [Helicobacter felis]